MFFYKSITLRVIFKKMYGGCFSQNFLIFYAIVNGENMLAKISI